MRTAVSRWIPIGVVNLLLALAPGLAAAAPMSFSIALSGSEQVPPVSPAGSGSAKLTYDPATRNLTWDIMVSGTGSAVTMAHLHGPAMAGKDAPPVIWLSKKGSEVQGPIKGAATLTEEQAAMLKSGELYINVHTKDHPKGEVRGQVIVPKG
jgi:hypothetical protein